MTNIDLIAAIRDLPVRDSARLKDALMGTLSRLSGGAPLPVRAFRDRFSAINREVSEGGVQLVATAGSQNVLVSLDSLAALIESVHQSMSFADQLEMSGFEALDVAMVEDQDPLDDEGLVFGTAAVAEEA